MRINSISKNLTILLVLFASCLMVGAQEPANQQQQSKQNAGVMTESDRLPFMQTDEISTTEEPGTGGMMIKTFGSLFLIIGLLFFGAWGVKKYGLFGINLGATENSPELKVTSSVSIANGQMISVVRFGDRVLLVGSTPQSFTLLADEYSDSLQETNFEPKSVSALLAEENKGFGTALNAAKERLPVWQENGGRI